MFIACSHLGMTNEQWMVVLQCIFLEPNKFINVPLCIHKCKNILRYYSIQVAVYELCLSIHNSITDVVIFLWYLCCNGSLICFIHTFRFDWGISLIWLIFIKVWCRKLADHKEIGSEAHAHKTNDYIGL